MTDFSPIEGVSDLARNLADDPVQPKLKTYPKKSFGSKRRVFSKDWFAGRPWLEYSKIADSALCYCCRAFQNFNTSSIWTHLWFSNWKSAMNNDKGLKGHEMSVPHLEACQKWTCFCEAAKSGSILAKINIVSRRDILKNRHFLKTVSQVILPCSVQDLGFRGHREGRMVYSEGEYVEQGFNCGARNRGNFLEILSSYAIHDSIILSKLQGPKNAQYVHHDIQNTILTLLAKSVRDDILLSLKSAKYFSLMCDESKDCVKDEQISVSLRYSDKGLLHEDFYNFVRAEGLDAESVKNTLKAILNGMEVDVSLI